MTDALSLAKSELPSYLTPEDVNSDAGRLDNEEGMTGTPRLLLTQSNSPQFAKQNAAVGDYYSTVHCSSFGDEIDVVPVCWQREWVEFFGDDDEEVGVKTRKLTRNEAIAEWGSEEFWRYEALHLHCLAPIGGSVTPQPVAFTFKGWGSKPGNEMYNTSIHGIQAPIQAQLWTLGCESKPGKKGSEVKAPTVRFKGHAAEDHFKAAVEFCKLFADKDLSVDFNEEPGSAKVKGDEDMPF